MPDRTLRRRAAALAGHEGDAATARAALSDPDAGVRGTALGALARTGALTAIDVTAALDDPDPAVRRRAAEEAAALPVEAGPVDLGAHLSDGDATVVEVVAWACGERPATAVDVERLSDLVTGHDDALVREAAVAALGALGDDAGLPAVLAATGDRATVRRRAVLALAPFSGPDVDAALARARTDRDWQVRQAAEDLGDGGEDPGPDDGSHRDRP